MKTVLKSDLDKLVEIGEVEVFTPAQLKSYVEMSNDSISKSEGSKEEMYKSVVDEMRSFEPVVMWDDNSLQKSTVMVRPAQIAWDNKGDDIEKSLSGRFLDTELNRKFDRVGLHYPMVDPIEKAKKAVIGEIREWSDGKYRKTAKGWEYIKGSDPKGKGKGDDMQKLAEDMLQSKKDKLREEGKDYLPEQHMTADQIKQEQEGEKSEESVSLKFNSERVNKQIAEKQAELDLMKSAISKFSAIYESEKLIIINALKKAGATKIDDSNAMFEFSPVDDKPMLHIWIKTEGMKLTDKKANNIKAHLREVGVPVIHMNMISGALDLNYYDK